MTLKLKQYQEKTLDVLTTYLKESCLNSAEHAYKNIQSIRYASNNFKPYQALNNLNNIPYVCLRLPTGGGKTLLSSHTIGIAAQHYLQTEYPLTLWLVPTESIKAQTLETLKNPLHANYAVLDKAFNGKFKIFDIDDFRHIRPTDIRDNACIVLSTFAKLRVDKTEGYKVYKHDENLETHFTKILHFSNGMECDETGKIKYSFVNLLHHHNPLVIIDEAHNAKSDLSVDILKRINASCVIEYTATPADNSNIIHSVTASELKTEQMIKLPIILTPHLSWQDAITASIHTRANLETIPDKDYIRPIILFQAENKGQEVTVDVLKEYLINNENIPAAQIAIVTSDQKELDNINLFDVNCPIKYVITVQALKEGWDCSFAYVLCSVANTKSKTAIEQLLGRVLRMPYATKRENEALNKAYAHVSSTSWKNAVSTLTDCLIDMGFEQQEAEQFTYSQPTLNISSEQTKNQKFITYLSVKPDLLKLDLTGNTDFQIDETPTGKFKLEISQETATKEFIETFSKTILDKNERREFELQGQKYISQQYENLSPAQKGQIFTIPQLCLKFDSGIELAERELLIDNDTWLLEYYKPLTESDFSLNFDIKQTAIDIDNGQLKQTALMAQQLFFNHTVFDMNEKTLCHWLDRRLGLPYIKQEILLEFIRRTVRDLLNRSDMNLDILLRGKFKLEVKIKELIGFYYTQACKQGFQQSFFDKKTANVTTLDKHTLTFDKNNYPVNCFYNGRKKFKKHYYKLITDMNSEEANCAEIIDNKKQVEFWVKNIERQPQFSFWLPTSTDKFYPDFVAKLNDNRLLVIEYKGGQFEGTDDVKEKELIGEKWAELTGNLFLMAWKKDKNGHDLHKQIDDTLQK
jgi:type III restriction enzyme